MGAACGGLKALHPSAKVPARKIRLRIMIPSGTLGPDAVQNCGLCHFTAIPGSDQPWQGMRDRVCAGWSRSHEPGRADLGSAPTACSGPRLVPEGQARFHGCGGHRIAYDRNCPVGAGLLTRPPVFGTGPFHAEGRALWASSFFRGEKGPKRRLGYPAVASRLQRGHPLSPVYGGYPYTLPQKFRRAESGSRF